jgi:hypothetical protein
MFTFHGALLYRDRIRKLFESCRLIRLKNNLLSNNYFNLSLLLFKYRKRPMLSYIQNAQLILLTRKLRKLKIIRISYEILSKNITHYNDIYISEILYIKIF